MAAWGCRTFIAMLNIEVKLKAFHQYMVRTKSWKHSELGFLSSGNWIHGFFRWFWICVIFGVILCLLSLRLSLAGGIEFEILTFPIPSFPPAASLKTAPNRGGGKGLRLFHGRSHIVPASCLWGSFSKKCCGRHRSGANIAKGQEGTALSYKLPACCHLNSLFIHLQVAHSLLPNPICPISVTTANVNDVW